MIKTLGRWGSLAYLEYIKIPRDQLASYSGILAAWTTAQVHCQSTLFPLSSVVTN